MAMAIGICGGRYTVDEDGNVFSVRYGRLLKPYMSNSGYYMVTLDGKNVYVHRLVAKAFVPNPNCKLCVNHKDGNKLNNNVSNLEWVTYSENLQHAYDVTKVRKNGEDFYSAKLTNEQVERIRCEYATGYFRQWELAKKYGVRQPQISRIVNYLSRREM